MKLITPEIVWHNKEPVLSAHFHRNGPLWRLVTGGADNDVKMWKVTVEEEKLRMVFVSSLSRHTKSVNVVRFAPNGELLASAGDDSVVYLWKLTEGTINTGGGGNLVSSETAGNKENWNVVKILRGHLEDVYDLCWSPDSNFIISGSVDNTAIIWDIQKGQMLTALKEPRQYVQGVAWDPLGRYVATLSCDRNLRIYTIGTKFKCIHTVSKLSTRDQDGGTKQFKMWMDESLNSFFRRLSFTPDGSFLITPGGTFEVGDKAKNSTYVFARNNLTKPVLQLPGPEKPTVCVRCSPVLYELLSQPEDTPSLTSLPYRMVYAVASIDSVLLYDTQHTVPFAFVSNIHYAAITDMAWSNDGQTLVITSSDCYCSILTFEPSELGTPLPVEKMPPLLSRKQPSTTPEQKKQSDKQKSPNKVPPPSVSHNGEHKDSADLVNKSAPSKIAQSTPPRPTKESASKVIMNGISSSPDDKPRRIRPTTIETFSSPKQTTSDAGSPSPTSIDPSCDKSLPDSERETVDVISSSPSRTISSTSTDHSSVQNTSSPLGQESSQTTTTTSASLLPSAKSVSSSNGGPRRVNFITLSSFSSSQSTTTNSSKASEAACTVKNSSVDPPQVEQNVNCDKKRNDEEPMEV